MSNQNKDDLKPCPFCGNDKIDDGVQSLPIQLVFNEASTVIIDGEEVHNNDEYTVQCDKCTATMGYSETEAEAIAAWNTRPEIPTQKTHESPVVDVDDLYNEFLLGRTTKMFSNGMYGAEPFKCGEEFKAGYLARGPVNAGWVEIADIPEEWKDGRPVDLWVVRLHCSGFRLNDCLYKETVSEGYSNWKSWNYHCKEGTVKFAMLSPPPPNK